MAYKIHNDNKVTLIKDNQINIKLIKETINLKEINGNVLLGNWIRVLDLIRDIKKLHSVIITANEIKALSNTCSLSISSCGSFIRKSNNNKIDSIKCSQVEKDSIWFSKIPYVLKFPLTQELKNTVSYIEVIPIISEEFNNEILGQDLYQNIIPLLTVDFFYYLPTME